MKKLNDTSISFADNSFDIISMGAAIWVMLAHTIAWVLYEGKGSEFLFWRILAPGPAVVIMFVVSGFLVSASYERSTNIKEFYLKRVFRIYPALMVVVSGSTLVSIVYTRKFEIVSVVKAIVGSLFLGQSGGGLLPQEFFGNGSLWTICVQIQIYFCIPFLVYIYKKTKRPFLFLFVFMMFNLFDSQIMSFWENLSGFAARAYKLTCLPYLYMFWIGIVCYAMRDKILPILVKWWKVLLAFYILFQWILGLDSVWSWKYCNPFSALTIGFGIIGVAYAFGKVRLKSEVSYDIYLLHMPMADLWCNIVAVSIRTIAFLLTWISTFLMGALLARFVEVPARRRGTKLIDKMIRRQI